nr:sulfatase-like hydrolase/transferase [Kiritimatiellia bacterium]
IYLTEALTRELLEEISLTVNDEQPFFAYMAHYAVHAPFQEDARFADNYPTLSSSERAYATQIEGMDKSLGDLLTHLETLGVAENTLILFMSDNGGDSPIPNNNTTPIVSGNAPLRGKKAMRYEGGIRVPMIAAWSKRDPTNSFQQQFPIPEDGMVHDIVAAEDVYPTLLTIAGAETLPEVDGEDLSPYLKGEEGVHRTQMQIIHYPHDHNNAYFSLLRAGDWKLIYNYGDTSYELYNLKTDLSESTNLADQEPERLMALSRQLAKGLMTYGAQFPVYVDNGANRSFYTPPLLDIDLDQDQLPDIEEDPNRNGLQDAGETNPDLKDSDGDNASDGLEVFSGTDPLDVQSRFFISITPGDSNLLQFRFPITQGTMATIEGREEISSGQWAIHAEGIQAGGPEYSIHLPYEAPLSPTYFYRIRLERD